MAKTNCFAVGSIVKHNGRIGRVIHNAIHDCRYWQIDFCNTIEYKHYKDLELVSSTTEDYEERTGGNWWDGAIQLFGNSKCAVGRIGQRESRGLDRADQDQGQIFDFGEHGPV